MFKFVETLCEDQDSERHMSCVHCLCDYFFNNFHHFNWNLNGVTCDFSGSNHFFTLLIQKGYDNSWTKSILNLLTIALMKIVLKKAQLPRFLLVVSLQMKFAFDFGQPAHVSLCIYPTKWVVFIFFIQFIIFYHHFECGGRWSLLFEPIIFTLLITSDYS